jgi:hypothetical protein
MLSVFVSCQCVELSDKRCNLRIFLTSRCVAGSEANGMPEEEATERAREDERQGKSPSTQAGEFVREEMEHIREGEHGARSPEQAIATGLSKARRAGVKLPPPRRGESRTKGQAKQDLAKGRSGRRKKPGTRRSRNAPSGARVADQRRRKRCRSTPGGWQAAALQGRARPPRRKRREHANAVAEVVLRLERGGEFRAQREKTSASSTQATATREWVISN